MFLVDADLHGPAVLAIHRLLADVDGATILAGLEGDFDARPAGSPAEAEEQLGRLPRRRSPSACTRTGGAGCWWPATRPAWPPRRAAPAACSTSRSCTVRC
jgi:hypothetical protein